MSRSTQDSYSIGMSTSPPPPVDIGAYARSMHQHTKRQMEAANQSSLRRSQSDSSQHNGGAAAAESNGTSAMPNGVSSSVSSSQRGNNSGDYRHHT